MKFRFPIVIIDEDFRSENASGLGIRALAAAIEKEGMEILGVTSYGDLSQFAQQQSRASAFILSIDDEEFTPGPELDPALLSRLDEVRRKVTKPLAVGFGISEHAHYEALRGRCDAVVVGSAIVGAIADGEAAGAPARAAAGSDSAPRSDSNPAALRKMPHRLRIRVAAIATQRSMAILGSRPDAAFRTVAAIMRLLAHLLRALPLLPVRSCQVHHAIPLTAPPWEL